MIPWPVEIRTSMSPDQVISRLLEVTDTSVGFIMGKTKEFDCPEEEKAAKKFGGKIDLQSHSFKLLHMPYSFFSYWGFKILYQGNVVSGNQRSVIDFWVRPSAIGLFLFVSLIILTAFAILQATKNDWNWEWTKPILIIIAVWCIAGFFTFREVKNAKHVFESLFSESPPPYFDS